MSYLLVTSIAVASLAFGAVPAAATSAPSVLDERVASSPDQVPVVQPRLSMQDSEEESEDTVAPLPATVPSAEPTPLPSDESVVPQPAPVFKAPGNESGQPTSTDTDWVAPYRDGGTVEESSERWSVWTTGAAMLTVGTGVGLIFAPPVLALMAASTVVLPDTVFEGLGTTGLVLVVGLGAVGATSIVAPAAISLVQTFIGDWVSPRRGALAWPLIAAYTVAGAAWMTTALSVSTTVGIVKDASRRGENVDAIAPVVLSLLVPAVAGLVLTVVAPAATYFIMSEEKRVGDDGRGFPGLLSPNHAAVEIPLHSLRVVDLQRKRANPSVRF